MKEEKKRIDMDFSYKLKGERYCFAISQYFKILTVMCVESTKAAVFGLIVVLNM